MLEVAVCQMSPGPDKRANLAKAERMIEEASQGASLVVLPEMFNCPYQNSLFVEFAEAWPKGETLSMLARLAGKNHVFLVGGSLPEKEGGKIYNSSFVFGPDGSLLGRYRKMHLFDVHLEGQHFKESASLSAGDCISVLPTPLCVLGQAVCYDVRFPELFRLLALKGAQVVVLPGNFNLVTGPAHWELSLRMRAVDNQVFVIGASCARDEKAPYVSYGHSLVVDPWGTVQKRAGTGEEILRASIDLDWLARVRATLPLLLHRRGDVYTLKETCRGDC